MDNNMKFTLAIDSLNNKIAELNIKISKDQNNKSLKQELELLLKDRETLYKGTNSYELEKLIEKYGSKI